MDSNCVPNFALARTALKYGLIALKPRVDHGILVPDYICDVVFDSIHQAGLNTVTYPVTDTFDPDWDAINGALLKESICALFVVHYFGQPQNLDLYRKFCTENNIWLIEDNSHGHGGCLNGQLLGTFGDIGFSSPRKILGLPYGAMLYNKPFNTVKTEKLIKIRPFHLHYYPNLLKIGLSYFPMIKGQLKSWLNHSNDWSNPLLYMDDQKIDYETDSFSLHRISSTNWSNIAYRRRANWEKWSNFASTNGLNPIFSSVHPESCPWAIPVYANDLEERNKWLIWGSKNAVNVFPWPTLSKEIINDTGLALERWKRLLCFPLDVEP